MHEEATKGARGMPWHDGPKKDVVGCEKPRGAASRHRSVGVRMGKPGVVNPRHRMLNT